MILSLQDYLIYNICSQKYIEYYSQSIRNFLKISGYMREKFRFIIDKTRMLGYSKYRRREIQQSAARRFAYIKKT